jgi:hypothetical protein
MRVVLEDVCPFKRDVIVEFTKVERLDTTSLERLVMPLAMVGGELQLEDGVALDFASSLATTCNAQQGGGLYGLQFSNPVEP